MMISTSQGKSPHFTDEDILAMIGSARPFSPYAIYDKQLDCIRIRLRDCSVTEERFHEAITVLFDNHKEEGQTELAGLTIKGVHHFLGTMTGVQLVTKVLDTVLGQLPQKDRQRLEKIDVLNNPVLINSELQVQLAA